MGMQAGGGAGKQNNVFRVTQALVAGTNAIVHNLGRLPTIVDVRDAPSGTPITASVTLESTTQIYISVGVAVASARISIIV
jgi:hypothetical protein